MGRLIILAGMLLAVTLTPYVAARSALADDSGFVRPADLVAMAEIAEARGDSQMAIALYRRAHEAFPWASAPLTGWGLLAARLGATDQAATLLTAALDVAPDDIEAASGLAEVLVDLDRPIEALALYEAVLEVDPADIAARDGRLYVLALIASPAQTAIPSTLAAATGTESGKSTPAAAPALTRTTAPAEPESTTAVWR